MKKLLTFLLTVAALSVSAQTRQISGTVTGADDGAALVGAVVMVEGSNAFAATDASGVYAIQARQGDVLTFSLMGYTPQTHTVGTASTIDVSLAVDATMIEDLVVIGYGVQQKKLVTGATVQVKGDDIAKLNTTNVLGALSSQTPGVNITQSSGMPGEEGYKVNIRGLGTVGNASPLYVIDGVPGGDLNNLNPADIQSLDVLKDAAAAAIYGSRAANGVILVTTKQGRKGKVEVSLDGYYGIQNIYRMPRVLNAQEFAVIANEAALNDGMAVYDFAKLVPDWDKIASGEWKGTNWLKESQNKNAPVQNYALNITGGTDLSTFSIGLGYTAQEGTIGKPRVPQYERYTARINSEYTLVKGKKFDIVKFGENLSYSYRQNQGRIGTGDRWSNTIYNLMRTSPFLPVYNEDGTYHAPIDWEVRQTNTMADMAYRADGRGKNHAMRAKLYLDVQPIEKLLFRSSFGYSMSAGSSRTYTPSYYISEHQRNETEQVEQTAYSGYGLTWENTLSYDFDILDDHHFTALLGQSIEKSGMGEELGARNDNPRFHDWEHAFINNAPLTQLNNGTAMWGGPWGMHRLASFFGRVSYDYKDKYMATVVLRADGSSNFKRGNRWGYFPSVSAGWVITEEPWMAKTKGWMDFFKIRASWGQNGNQAVNNFQYVAPISTGNRYVFGNDKNVTSVGAYPSILPNENISWEVSEQLDLGFDATFLRGRLGVVFDYYVKNTKDWLVEAPQLASYGTGAPYINGGDVRNSGVELGFTWHDTVGGLSYNVGVNAAYNKNEVKRLANTEGIIHGPSSFMFQPHDEMYRAQVGQPIGYFYGYSTAGIFQNQAQIDNYQGAKLAGAQPGDVIWVDWDNNGVINLDDRHRIGNPHPAWRMGLNLSAEYKGFDLTVAMTAVLGNDIMRSWRSWGDSPKDNYTADILGRWHGEGTSNRLPRVTYQSNPNSLYISDLYMEDGSYLRMQNLTLGYDFKYLVKDGFFSSMRLYVAAQNLFTITKYSGMDPEIGFSPAGWSSGIDVGYYPSPRTFMLGASLKF